MLVPITNKMLVSGLEYTTVPISNLKVLKKHFDEYMKIISWVHNHDDVDANSPINKKWEKISSLLGTEPISHPTYSYRNALWALEWKKSNILLFYYDKTGIKLQVNNDITESDLKELIDCLVSKLT